MNIVSIQSYNFKGNFCKKPITLKKEDKTGFALTETFKTFNPLRKQILDEDQYFLKFLTKKGKVTKKEYDCIIKDHKRTLIKSYNLCKEMKVNSSPEIVAKLAVALKEYYDEIYGDYTILSVGRSPAVLTEVMQNIGCDVVFLPISNLKECSTGSLYIFRTRYPTIASRHLNIQKLMDYASKKGVGKQDDKSLLVLDFSDTGKTLKVMSKVLKERGDIDDDCIKTRKLLLDVADALDVRGKTNLKGAELYGFFNDIICSNFQDYVNVPRYVFNENYNLSKKETFKFFDKYSTKFGRAFSLCATHEAMKILQSNNKQIDYLKKNPAQSPGLML